MTNESQLGKEITSGVLKDDMRVTIQVNITESKSKTSLRDFFSTLNTEEHNVIKNLLLQKNIHKLNMYEKEFLKLLGQPVLTKKLQKTVKCSVVKVHCEVCDKFFVRHNMPRHLQSKGHLLKIEKESHSPIRPPLPPPLTSMVPLQMTTPPPIPPPLTSRIPLQMTTPPPIPPPMGTDVPFMSKCGKGGKVGARHVCEFCGESYCIIDGLKEYSYLLHTSTDVHILKVSENIHNHNILVLNDEFKMKQKQNKAVRFRRVVLGNIHEM